MRNSCQKSKSRPAAEAWFMVEGFPSVCKALGSTASHERGKRKNITQRSHYSIMILYFYQILSKRLIIFDFFIKYLFSY